MKKIALAEYEILFDDSLESLNLFIQKNSYSKVFVLVDENTILCCLEKLISKLFDWLDFGLNQTSDHSLINIKDIYELIIDLKDIGFENNDTRKIVELLKKFDNSLE